MTQSDDYYLLTHPGNIAFYESSEVTELFLDRKKDRKVFNILTLCALEEKPYEARNEQYLSDRTQSR